ncbi:MAG TPA: flagellin [bacterium]|nr:flagellin [bacterium]
MIAVNTNVYAMYTRNYSRLNQLEYNEKIERLSSGYQINKAADDPSGLAISSGMTAQIRGTNVAISNAEDTIQLLQLTDDFMDGISDKLLRMRDLSLRLANIATINNHEGADASDLQFHDCMNLQREIEVLKDDIYMSVTLLNPYDGLASNVNDGVWARINYNHKNIFTSNGPGFATGLDAQVGANNDASNRIAIIIDDLVIGEFNNFATPYAPPDPPGDATLNWYQGYAYDKIEDITSKLDKLNDLRNELGTQVNRLEHTIDDLYAESTWTSDSRSRILDANMAEEITAFTKNQIKQQTTNITYSQANAQPLITVELLDAIYDGLNPSMVGNTAIGS